MVQADVSRCFGRPYDKFEGQNVRCERLKRMTRVAGGREGTQGATDSLLQARRAVDGFESFTGTTSLTHHALEMSGQRVSAEQKEEETSECTTLISKDKESIDTTDMQVNDYC